MLFRRTDTLNVLPYIISSYLLSLQTKQIILPYLKQNDSFNLSAWRENYWGTSFRWLENSGRKSGNRENSCCCSPIFFAFDCSRRKCFREQHQRVGVPHQIRYVIYKVPQRWPGFDVVLSLLGLFVCSRNVVILYLRRTLTSDTPSHLH